MPHITHIEIRKFWNQYQIDWTLDPQVNILFGFNGSGKTTVLSAIEDTFRQATNDIGLVTNAKSIKGIPTFIKIIFDNEHFISLDDLKSFYERTLISFQDILYQKISTFDINIDSQDNKFSPLYQTLQTLVYGDGTSDSQHFEKYRSKRLDLLDEGKKKEADRIEENIQAFYQIVNTFFAVTNKTIVFKDQKMFFKSANQDIQLEQLSAGEKQLLIILLNVLLQDKQPYILLMDEPEISLHITWQQILIEKILELNPNCQLIIATHSPSVFGQGWRDKVFRMENLLTIEGA